MKLRQRQARRSPPSSRPVKSASRRGGKPPAGSKPGAAKRGIGRTGHDLRWLAWSAQPGRRQGARRIGRSNVSPVARPRRQARLAKLKRFPAMGLAGAVRCVLRWLSRFALGQNRTRPVSRGPGHLISEHSAYAYATGPHQAMAGPRNEPCVVVPRWQTNGVRQVCPPAYLLPICWVPHLSQGPVRCRWGRIVAILRRALRCAWPRAAVGQRSLMGGCVPACVIVR
jgi:hypothetical protein